METHRQEAVLVISYSAPTTRTTPILCRTLHPATSMLGHLRQTQIRAHQKPLPTRSPPVTRATRATCECAQIKQVPLVEESFPNQTMRTTVEDGCHIP